MQFIFVMQFGKDAFNEVSVKASWFCCLPSQSSLYSYIYFSVINPSLSPALKMLLTNQDLESVSTAKKVFFFFIWVYGG